jgi:hypothetical protein
MRARVLAIAALAMLATACVDTLSPGNSRFGIITATTTDDGASGFKMAPEGAFYDESNLSYAAPAAESCYTAPYTTINTLIGNVRTLNVGPYIVTKVSGRTDSLQAQQFLTLLVYRPVLTTGIPFVPGDTLRVEVPGESKAGGFPPATLSIRTAEAFTFSPIGVPLVDEDLPLSWTPAPSPGSLMTFSLRYPNQYSTGELNEQLYCAFVDDGSATIPAARLAGWRDAVGDRETRAVRLRSIDVMLDSRTQFVLRSTFSQPLTASAPQ